MFKKNIEEILNNNPGLVQVLKLKGVNETDINNINEELSIKNNTFKSYGINLTFLETLLFLILNNEKENISNVNDIEIKNFYKINNNNYQENIGDTLLVTVGENKYLGIFLGSIPLDYEIIKKENKIIIEFKNYNGLIYIPELEKLFTTREVWIKKVPNDLNNKIKTDIKNIFSKYLKQILKKENNE